ncbi:INO80 complex subunit D [Homalodisca vitripennis]|nr:INO80 complex subunit D [Homalodisca vitripennis]
MQDALSQDMFNLGGISSSRCNGHIPVSSAGKAPKRDRKGCKKGKIEAIMKNNLVSSKARVRLQTAAVVKKLKPVQSVSNHIIKPGTVIKSEYIDSDDPYTFTETEPQVLSLYPGGNNLTLSRKLVPLVSNRSNQLVVNKSGVNMVCMDRNSDMGKVKTLAERLTTQGGQTIELPSRPFIKVNKVVQNLEGSSKTMNRLQADIARNKIMGKRKKMVVNNQSGSVWGERDVKTEPNGHANSPVFANVSIPAKRTHRQTTWQRERKSRHEALQRIQQTQQRAWDLTHDLYPLGKLIPLTAVLCDFTNMGRDTLEHSSEIRDVLDEYVSSENDASDIEADIPLDISLRDFSSGSGEEYEPDPNELSS